MKDFYNKDEFEIEDLRLLIENEVEESVFLDFKSSLALSKADSKKKEIAKDVSALANAEGGILIYGIEEQNHKASKINYVDGNEFTKEWLEHVINSNIQRKIENIRIIPIRENGDIKKTVYLVKVPKSNRAPHITCDKRFYKRYNFESVMMEEYEIRNLYLNKSKSDLVIASWDCRQSNKSDNNHIKYICEVDIYNNGDVSETSFKVNIIFDNFSKDMDLSWDSVQHKYQYTIMGNGRVKISAPASSPIFPQEYLNGFRANLEIPYEKISDLDEIRVLVHLFYPNGNDKISSSLLVPWYKKEEDL
jgi:hypothetical protein